MEIVPLFVRVPLTSPNIPTPCSAPVIFSVPEFVILPFLAAIPTAFVPVIVIVPVEAFSALTL